MKVLSIHRKELFDDNWWGVVVTTGRYELLGMETPEKAIETCRKMLENLDIPPGYVRSESNYTISPNGRFLDFKLIDKEIPVPTPEAPPDDRSL